jgi:hypothetical protein
MPIKLNDKGGSDFEPIPAGVHQAVCYGVVDIGTQPSKNSKYGPKREMRILFELPHERGDFGEGKENLPRGISVKYSQSLSQKANLRKALESWRGRAFTPQELEGFDPKVLIGVNAQLNLVHEDKGDKTYVNVKAIMPLGKGQPKVAQENKSLYFSLDDQPDLSKIKYPENMPNWLKEQIAFSDEVLAASGHGDPHGEDGDGGEPGEPQGRPASSRPAANPAHQEPEGLDEDVPF